MHFFTYFYFFCFSQSFTEFGESTQMWIMLLSREMRNGAYSVFPALSMETLWRQQNCSLETTIHYPKPRSLTRGVMTISGARKDTLIEVKVAVRWTIWTDLTSLSQAYQRKAIFKGKRKLILDVTFLRQGHQCLDFPPIEKWGLCPFPTKRGVLVPALTNGVW